MYFKPCIKENNCQPILLYLANITFKFEQEIKNLSLDKHKLKKFMTTKPASEKTLKGALYPQQAEKINQLQSGKDQTVEKQNDKNWCTCLYNNSECKGY